MSNKPFKMQFSHPCPFRKGEILTYNLSGRDLLVLKVYKSNWFKRLLYRAFGVKPLNGCKVKFL